ncbi:MAG: hypothetical protein CMC55_01200 [Flavobacteriaceae bacterium]|uniref:glycosyltransferase family 2 protein n=1 Tax=Bizionia echini TaxID=649333 RepID=UPI000C995822|nr:hypothetical protein [Flavobacteriaceae bacterium]
MALQPLVSIIIPTYNRAHLLGETLDSVLAQTYPNWECLVVDDGSTDGTAELLNHYIAKDSRFHYHKRPDSHLAGGNGARNYGFELSSGDYIQWFDSDDLMLPTKLELKLDAILEHDVDFVVCENAEIFSRHPYKVKKRWLIQTEGNVLLNHLKGRVAFTTAGPLFRKSFLKDKPLFDERVLISQEWEFFSRLLTVNPKMFYVKHVLYHFKNLQEGIRGELSAKKIINRTQTELRLFNFINRTTYFNNSEYLEAYNQYKFFWIYNKYRYLNTKFSVLVSLPYLLKGLCTVSGAYYFKSMGRIIKKPTIAKVLFKGWNKN